jgi:tricorn protease-like protein
VNVVNMGVAGKREVLGIEEVPQTSRSAPVAWSPDGEQLLVQSGATRHVLLWDMAGGDAIDLGEALKLGEPQWSADGRYIAIERPGAPERDAFIDIVTADGQSVRTIELGITAHKPRFSPHGQTLAFAVKSASGADAEDVYVVELPAGEPRLVADVGMNLFQLSWSADGSYLAFTAGPVVGEGCPSP